MIILLSYRITDDGAYYFDEKLVDAQGHQGPLAASSAVVCGITSFATVSAENLNVCCVAHVISFFNFMKIILDKTLLYDVQLPGDKILGLARFFLGIGVPGNAKDLYYQVEALASLENNRCGCKIYFIFLFSNFFCICFVSVKCCVFGFC